MKKRALFLDRDGVINIPPPPEVRYILEPDAFHLMPGIAEAVRLCNQHRVPVVVITNQKCVATGKLSLEDLTSIHHRMEALLNAEGAYLDRIYFCPHAESDQCNCRKPLPGMILRALRDLKLDPADSWMVGDQPRDILAGNAAGCHTLHISPAPAPFAECSLPDTQSLPQWIFEHFLQKEDCHADFERL
ncbi:MAG: HAD family hydrolase [Verrucomicrobia bacterium]|nr:HAD family hydrolase [Verrucomicrobiota bacterium]MCH8527127.1 HAD family hydrolase [Kiritimatiellia bacterium]